MDAWTTCLMKRVNFGTDLGCMPLAGLNPRHWLDVKYLPCMILCDVHRARSIDVYSIPWVDVININLISHPGIPLPTKPPTAPPPTIPPTRPTYSHLPSPHSRTLPPTHTHPPSPPLPLPHQIACLLCASVFIWP